MAKIDASQGLTGLPFDGSGGTAGSVSGLGGTDRFGGVLLAQARSGSGSGNGTVVPNTIYKAPAPTAGANEIVKFTRGPYTRVEPSANNIVNFVRPVPGSGNAAPVNGGLTLRTGQPLTSATPLFQQGAFVFAVPKGADPADLSQRTYVGAAQGFSATALLRKTMEVQGFPTGDTVVWNAGLPKQYQVTAAEARQILALEGQVAEGSDPDVGRAGRALQQAEAKLTQKLIGGLNYTLGGPPPARITPENSAGGTQWSTTPSPAPKTDPVASPPPEAKPVAKPVASSAATLTLGGNTFTLNRNPGQAVPWSVTLPNGQSFGLPGVPANPQASKSEQAQEREQASNYVKGAFASGSIPGVVPPSSPLTLGGKPYAIQGANGAYALTGAGLPAPIPVPAKTLPEAAENVKAFWLTGNLPGKPASAPLTLDAASGQTTTIVGGPGKGPYGFTAPNGEVVRILTDKGTDPSSRQEAASVVKGRFQSGALTGFGFTPGAANTEPTIKPQPIPGPIPQPVIPDNLPTKTKPQPVIPDNLPSKTNPQPVFPDKLGEPVPVIPEQFPIQLPEKVGEPQEVPTVAKPVPSANDGTTPSTQPATPPVTDTQPQTETGNGNGGATIPPNTTNAAPAPAPNPDEKPGALAPIPGVTGTQVPKVERVEVTGNNIVPGEVGVGRTEPQPFQNVADPLTPSRVAEILGQDPSKQVSVVGNGKVVKVTYDSAGETRNLYIGNYRDLASVNGEVPDIQRQTAGMPLKYNVYYNGKPIEVAEKKFKGADLVAVVVDPNQKVIGTSTLTYQTAAFGQPAKQPDGTTKVDNPELKQVLFLGQVTGTKGAGRQALDSVLKLAEESKTTVVATTYANNVYNLLDPKGALGRPGIYGPKPGTDPDFAMIYAFPRTDAKNPETGLVNQLPTKDPLQFFSFDPDRGVKTVQGVSIFAGVPGAPKLSTETQTGDNVADNPQVAFGWLYGAKNPDKPTQADIPLFVYNDNRLGDAYGGLKVPGTESYYVPLKPEALQFQGQNVTLPKPPVAPFPNPYQINNPPTGETINMPPPGVNPNSPTTTSVTPVVPPEFVKPGQITFNISQLPPAEQALANQALQQSGKGFVQTLKDGTSVVSQYVGATVKPVTSFTNDVKASTQVAGNLIWNQIPPAGQTAITNTAKTAGFVLGAAIDPIGTTFSAGLAAFDKFAKSPVGQTAFAPVVQFANKAGELGQSFADKPIGREIAGIWNNSIGNPRFAAVAGKFTTGAGKAVQVVTNGGLGLLAAGVTTGQTKFGTFVAHVLVFVPGTPPPPTVAVIRAVWILRDAP